MIPSKMSKQAKVHPLRVREEKHEMRERNHFHRPRVSTTSHESWRRLSLEMKAVSRWKNFQSSMRIDPNRTEGGPGPRDRNTSKRTRNQKQAQCALDSDVDNLGQDQYPLYDTRGYMKPLPNVSHGEQTIPALANSRAMLIYFAKLAKASLEHEQELDFDFIEGLLEDGADINFTDRHGQSILHEVARIWNVDVAKFVLENGGDVNCADSFGRTPLHVAAAVDYPEMVEFLINNNANIQAKTKGESQTPTHYAAKNDACNALKVLVKLGGSMEDRDYKERTPLQVAAELDRSETAKFIIEQGIAAGVQDDSGNCALSIMISKMPPVAKEALDQFHTTDRANRKQYYYLNYLEPDVPERDGQCYARTPLYNVVLFKQMELIMHPVFQRLIEVKWQKFGLRGVIWQIIVHFLYVFIWTALAVTLHIGEDTNYYYPPSKFWWRIVLETLAVSITFYFILLEFSEIRSSKMAHLKWQRWRIRQLEKDLQFCHPRWPEERKYLEMELREISDSGISYFNDAWNYFDWITYGWVIGMILTRALAVGLKNQPAHSLHPKVFAIGIIFIWLRLMKTFRAFSTLGPFIVMIGHIINDTLKFSVLYFELYFPYVCAFWIIFGGSKNAALMENAGQSSKGWESFNDLMYSVWQLTVVGNYPWDSLLAVDRLMAQILCGTYLAVSAIIMLNLFIALMSDTFQRVYDNAKANSAMQRASAIIYLEENMSIYRRDRLRAFLNSKLAPEELYYDDDSTVPSTGELERMTHQIKDVVDEVLETIKEKGSDSGNGGSLDKERERLRDDLASISERHESSVNEMRREMAEMKTLLSTLVQSLTKPQALPSIRSLQSLPPPDRNVRPTRSAGSRTGHRKRRQRDRSSRSDDEDVNEDVPYKGLPLPSVLPSVSSIISSRATPNRQDPQL